MENESNVWGTKPSGIQYTLEAELDARVPMYGGMLVQHVIHNNGSECREDAGYVIELCADFVCIRVLGTPAYRKYPRSWFTHIGDYNQAVNQAELEQVAKAEYDIELMRRAAAAVDAEFDALFDRLPIEYTDAPHIEYQPAGASS